MGMMEKCDQTDAYTGEGRPQCDDGQGCVSCQAKHHKYLDENRPLRSPDFQEFFDYVCMFKRVLQLGRVGKDDLPPETLYGWLDEMERSIRTGKYRHTLFAYERILAEMNSVR